MKDNKGTPIILLIIMVALVYAVSYGIDLINFIIKVKLFKLFM